MFSQRKLYWFCQVLGWFGMVCIEMINYTFFIIQEFRIEYLTLFSTMALCGILFTHMARAILLKIKLFEQRPAIVWTWAFLSSLAVAILLSITGFIPYLFAQPIQKFISDITFIELGASVMNWMRYTGVWMIVYSMYGILQHKSLLEKEKLNFISLAKSNELALLKSQLNPHFLFNALNSIKALVTIHPENSKHAIVQLSELLRYTLWRSQEETVPLAEEIEEVRKYLELEKIRFGEKLLVTFSIQIETFSYLIPPGIILTLAENAIKHGASKSEHHAFIHVSTILQNGKLLIEVENSGEIQAENKQGIGLLHIKKRLVHQFNDQFTFQLIQKKDSVSAMIQLL